jgi:DNA-binding winged helix-turn-helix (wHTH) protein
MVWGHQHVSESVLKTVISQVRSALEDDASRPRFVETASRLGYRFIGTVPAETGRAPAWRRSASPKRIYRSRIRASKVGRSAELVGQMADV